MLNNFITFNYYYKRFLTQIHDAACSLSCQFVPPQLPQNQQLLHPADDGIETSLVCVKECIWKKLWRSPKLHLQLRNKNFSTEFMPLPRSLNYVERVILQFYDYTLPEKGNTSLNSYLRGPLTICVTGTLKAISLMPV